MSADDDHARESPAELRRLLARHPRRTWREARSERIAFWLDVHDGFRQACTALTAAAADYRARRVRATELAIVTGPALHALLTELHAHHRVEDSDYFPTLRRQAPQLGAAFDALERDHRHLAHDLPHACAALAEVESAAERADATTLALAAAQYANALDRVCRRLERHLHDEENLVVPLLLERAEA